MAVLTKITQRVIVWINKNVGDAYLFYVIAVGVGVLCGVGAAVLKGGISLVIELLFKTLNVHTGNWVFILLPVFGILIATAYVHFMVKKPLDHASERVAADLANGTTNLSPRVIFGSVIGCSITLGMGGSAGAESPIAYTGAAIGSNVGRALKFNSEDISNLVGCGAAAGIAGIYMAPIGGMMYALEVLKMRQNLTTALALAFSSLVSALTCYMLLGCHNDVSFVPEMQFDNSLIPYVIICGIFCGVYSVYYSAVIARCSALLKRISNIWYRALLGGVALAVFLFMFPSLYGEGYGTLGHLMANDATTIIAYGPFYELGTKYFVLLLVFFVALLAVKPFATSATNDSGGVGGDFTPTLFCGGVAGYLFAVVLNHYFGLHLPVALFAFFGMAAVMSGAKEAPLMAIFITAEMTGMYGYILPLTIVALASMVTTVMLRKQRVISRYFAIPDDPQKSYSDISKTKD